ncbi:MAG TPA: hypothetical protein P5511_05815, partial [Candidatus Goldiibacteriota bacterium]|nr:hypothetical protein [Candidatus Goldiibacteriota bacterium]
PTPTVTQTRTATPANTATRTVTIAPTYTATPSEQGITDLKPWPNPINPGGTGTEGFIDFKINQKDPENIGIRIYTSSSRLIREIKYDQGSTNLLVNAGRFRYNIQTLEGLSNGTYYYYLYVQKGGKETRSKIDKIVIIK